jgi:hypothetical protein
MLRRVLTLSCAGLALAGLLAGATAVPAYADPLPPYTPTTLNVHGVAAGVFLNGLIIQATCEADVQGEVAATVIDQCYLTSNNVNHPEALPGNAVASTFREQVFTLDFQLCYHAYTIPLATPTEPVELSGCAGDPLPQGLGYIGAGTVTH